MDKYFWFINPAIRNNQTLAFIIFGKHQLSDSIFYTGLFNLTPTGFGQRSFYRHISHTHYHLQQKITRHINCGWDFGLINVTPNMEIRTS
jgi:hypothetical protein